MNRQQIARELVAVARKLTASITIRVRSTMDLKKVTDLLDEDGIDYDVYGREIDMADEFHGRLDATNYLDAIQSKLHIRFNSEVS